MAAEGDILKAGKPSVLPAILGTREAYSKKWTALTGERESKAKALLARYDAVLAQNQTALTQRLRIDEAMEVKTKREQIRAAWLKAP